MNCSGAYVSHQEPYKFLDTPFILICVSLCQNHSDFRIAKISPEIWQCISSMSLLLHAFKSFLSIPDFCFSYKFSIQLIDFHRKTHWNFNRDCIEFLDQFEGIGIFKTLSFLIHKDIYLQSMIESNSETQHLFYVFFFTLKVLHMFH